MTLPERRPLPTPHAVVIGAGSGGLTVAVGLATLGRRVRLVERGRVGGDCTNTGCIPSKALLHATATMAASGLAPSEVLAHVRRRRDELWCHETEEYGNTDNIDLQFGTARILGPGRVEVTTVDGTAEVVECRHIVVATGSRPREVPIQGLDGHHQLTNENLFELESPPAHLAILGAGAIGVEMATAFSRLGGRVTLVEGADRILPTYLPEASAIVTRRLEAAGVDVRVASMATGYRPVTGTLTLRPAADGGTGAGGSPPPRGGPRDGGGPIGGDRRAAIDGVDRVLVAVGRAPNTEGLGLAEVGVEIDRMGRIVTNTRGRASVPGIWAVGDASDRGGTTHAASAWGRRVFKAIVAPPAPAGSEPIVPAVTFTDPETAMIGHQPIEVPVDVRRIVVDLSRSDRSFTDRPVTAAGGESGTDRPVTGPESEPCPKGVVIVDVRRVSGRILGATVVGPAAGELISVFSLAMANRVRFPRWYGVVWPYPAHADVLGRAVDDFMIDHLRNLHRDLPRWLAGRLHRR